MVSGFVAQSYQQDILATGHADGSIYLWYVQTGQLLLKLAGHQSKILCLQFSPTQSILISSADQTIIVRDTEKGSMIGKLVGHKNFITVLVFSPNGQLIASEDFGCVIYSWHAEKHINGAYTSQTLSTMA